MLTVNPYNNFNFYHGNAINKQSGTTQLFCFFVIIHQLAINGYWFCSYIVRGIRRDVFRLVLLSRRCQLRKIVYIFWK